MISIPLWMFFVFLALSTPMALLLIGLILSAIVSWICDKIDKRIEQDLNKENRP